MSAGTFPGLRLTGWAAWLIRSLLLPALVLFAAVQMAQAHAVVTGTDPADNAVLPDPPAEVTVRFSEPVSLARAQVLDPAGQDILAEGAGRAEDNRLRLALPPSLAPGSYTVSYHVASLDGHPVAGSLIFSIGRVSASASGTQAADRMQAWRRAFVAVHALLCLGMSGAAGGVAFALLVRPGNASLDTNRRIAGASALLGLVAAPAALGLQGGLLLGGPWSILRDPATWAMGAGSAFGRTALCAMAGLLLIWLGSRARRPSGIGSLSLAGAALVLGSFALSGHVVTAGPRGVTTPILLVHVAMATFWVGSLIPLHRVLARPEREAGPAVERFSRIAIRAVPVLIAAGLVMAWLQVRRPEALLATAYGRVLLVKLALVLGLLGLAALNRFRFTPALVRGDAGSAARLGNSILAEIGLVMAILVATALLGATPPPRALGATASMDAPDAHAHQEHGHAPAERSLRIAGKGLEATVTLGPARDGTDAASIVLLDPEGQPFDVLEVTLRLSNPGRGIAPLKREAEGDSNGIWRVPDLVLATAGEWVIELDVLIGDFERQTLRGTLDRDK